MDIFISQIDAAIHSENMELEDDEEVDENEVLDKIRGNLVDNLKNIPNCHSMVYLISSSPKCKDKYDFPKLLKNILEELPAVKREVLLR